MKNKKLVKLINNLVDASFSKGKLDNFFVKKTISNLKKLKSNEAIYALEKYKKGLERRLNETTLSIESPAKLSTNEIYAIKKEMSKNYQITQIENIINKSLLGGLKIKIGDNLIDNSINARIKEVKQVIANP